MGIVLAVSYRCLDWQRYSLLRTSRRKGGVGKKDVFIIDLASSWMLLELVHRSGT